MLVNIVLLFLAFLLCIPILVLFLECVASLLPARSVVANVEDTRPRVAVVVPAHNEASGISQTLQTLMPQLTEQDQLVVVADNCTDDTAAVSRALGATVIERTNPNQRGKGYALDLGLQFLQGQPPDVVFMVDADCKVYPDTIESAVYWTKAFGRPLQVTYLLNLPEEKRLTDQISAFAFKVNTFVRPRGLARWGFPCLLHGTGMAFPWSVLQTVSLASGNIVEDMQLGVDLALAGHTPMFCSAGKVVSDLPEQERSTQIQRTRWEHGHLKTLLTQVPRLLQASFNQKRPELLVMALDLGIPPLSLLVLIWSSLTLVAIISATVTSSLEPVLLLGLEGILLLISIVSVWLKFGQDLLPLTSLLALPFYILGKIPIYLNFLIQPQTQWVRSDRK